MIVRDLGLVDYQTTWQNMLNFTLQRDKNTADEMWLLEHYPVFTQGDGDQGEHFLQTHSISIVKTDRGGQTTYHGPGQLVVYILLDLTRKKLAPQELVQLLEKSLLAYFTELNLTAHTEQNAPGIYIASAKIASLGLRIKNGCSYHGLAINVDMDLTPFSYIHPCGIKNQCMTQIKNFISNITMQDVKNHLSICLKQYLEN